MKQNNQQSIIGWKTELAVYAFILLILLFVFLGYVFLFCLGEIKLLPNGLFRVFFSVLFLGLVGYNIHKTIKTMITLYKNNKRC